MKIFLFVSLCGLLSLTNAAGYQDMPIIQFLQGSEFTVLTKLLTNTGLISALGGHGPFTVFAPTDAAFNAMDQTYLASLSGNTHQLLKLLKYHVVPEFVLKDLIFGNEIKQTLEGQEIDMSVYGPNLILNGNVTADYSKEVTLQNGIVQAIDSVLVPPIFGSESITQVIIMDDARLRDTALAMLLTGIYGILEVGDFTLFAPIDIAWAPYKDRILNATNPNASYYYHELMNYHIVPGGRTMKQLNNGDKLYTLHRTNIDINKNDSGVMLNNYATVIEGNIPASNGVIHVIDKLLIPRDLFPNAAPN